MQIGVNSMNGSYITEYKEQYVNQGGDKFTTPPHISLRPGRALTFSLNA